MTSCFLIHLKILCNKQGHLIHLPYIYPGYSFSCRYITHKFMFIFPLNRKGKTFIIQTFHLNHIYMRMYCSYEASTVTLGIRKAFYITYYFIFTVSWRQQTVFFFLFFLLSNQESICQEMLARVRLLWLWVGHFIHHT